MGNIRYHGRVAVISGAGHGPGRSYARYHAGRGRGAKALVNDLGGSTDGQGSDTRAADSVAEEIRALGGEAAANCDSAPGWQAPEGDVPDVEAIRDNLEVIFSIEDFRTSVTAVEA